MRKSKLPPDLVAFLTDGHTLKYEASKCEAGATELFSLDELEIKFFPMETGSLDNFEDDPKYPKTNSYLVPAVDLLRDCSEGYDPTGLMLWFPQEHRYGTWDSSHCFLSLFAPNVTWTNIVESPAHHINAQWVGMDPLSPPTEPLIPWLKYEYANTQYHEPLTRRDWITKR